MNSSSTTRTDPRSGRLHGLVLLRLLIATLLLGGMLLLMADVGYSGFTVRTLTLLIVSAYAGSALSAMYLSRGKPGPRFVPLQLLFDLLLASGFVYLSGAAASFFSILYGVTILAAALTSSPTGTRVTTLGAGLLYLLVGLSVAFGIVPAPSDQPAALYTIEGAQLGFVLIANLFGFTLVGALSDQLATRLDRTGTSLRNAEALNHDIVQSLTSGLVSIDPAGLIQAINPAGAAMLGGDAETLIGQMGWELLPGGPAAEHRGEGIAKAADGRQFPVGFTTTPMLGDQGTLVVFTDLTEIRSLKAAAERAERLAVLGRLASALAHEIRNPLGSISGSVQLVRDAEGLDAEDRDLLNIVLSEVDRLNDLVSQMLDVARPPKQRFTIANLRPLCAAVITMAKQDDAFSRVDLELVGECPDTRIDMSRFRQLVWNLIKNASQASPPNGTVRVTLLSRGTQAGLAVSDAGVGIKLEIRDHLFDMFYSGHDHGIGLGLAVVKQIVDRHEGVIRVDSSELGGARFTVWLPGVPPEPDADADTDADADADSEPALKSGQDQEK